MVKKSVFALLFIAYSFVVCAQLPSAVFNSIEGQEIKELRIYNCIVIDSSQQDSCVLLSELFYNTDGQLKGYGKYDKDTATHTIEYNSAGLISVYRIVENNQQTMQLFYYKENGELSHQKQFLNNEHVASLEYGKVDSTLIILRNSDYFDYSDTLTCSAYNRLHVLAKAMDIAPAVARQIAGAEKHGLKGFVQTFLEQDIVPSFEKVDYEYDFTKDILSINALRNINGKTYIYRVDLQLTKKEDETPTE